MDEETGQLYVTLLDHFGRKILAFRRQDGSWNSSAVMSSDLATTLENFLTLASAHGFQRDDDYIHALEMGAAFLGGAFLEGDMDGRDLARFMKGLSLAYEFTKNGIYLKLFEEVAHFTLPEKELFLDNTSIEDVVLDIATAVEHLPRGYKGKAKTYLEARIGDIDKRMEDARTKDEAVRTALALDLCGVVLGRKQHQTRAREYLNGVFEDNAGEIFFEEVLVSRYVHMGVVPDDEETTVRLRRFLKRRVIHAVKSEDASKLPQLADIARTRWHELFDQEESDKLSSKVDSLFRDKLIRKVNPDGGWGDDYIYRSTATAGIALFNMHLATGNETFRDAAHDAGEYLKNFLWDVSDGIFYSMDRISELFYLLHNDLEDEGYVLLLENYHERLSRSLEGLESDRERLLWYSAMLIIVTYYLQRMTGRDDLSEPITEISSNIVHLLDPSLYDTSYYPWFEASILAQEILPGDEGAYFGVFKPYLARMTIDEDTTIREEIAFQRFLYTYDVTPDPALLSTSARKAMTFLRKDNILNVYNLILIAKIYVLMEALDGGEPEDSSA